MPIACYKAWRDGNSRKRTTPRLRRRKRHRPTINPKEVSATSRVDREPPKPCFTGAAGGGGWNGMVSYLPLPRRGALSGKSARTCRRWRLFSCVLFLACSCLLYTSDAADEE